MLIEKGIEIGKWHRCLNAGIGVGFFVLAAVPIVALYTFLVTRDFEAGWEHWLYSLSKGGSKGKWAVELEIKEIDFFPKEESAPFLPLPDVEKKVVFLKKNGRPDRKEADKTLLLGIVGNGEKRFIGENEKVFFQCKNEQEISFSEEETPFWIEPKLGKEGRLEAIFKAKFVDRDGNVLLDEEKKLSFPEVEEVASTLTRSDHPLYPLAKGLEKVRVLPPDQLVELYGGGAFREEKGKYRLAFSNDQNNFIFIKPNMTFVFVEGSWQLSEGKTKGKPLFVIEKIDGKTCQAVLWDEEGLYSQTYKLPIIKTAPTDSFAKAFKKIRKRTEKSVTCALQNHNLILREGDWMLKVEKGWRNLSEASEVKDYLRYALKGELFIFDSIQKEGQTKYLIGNYFNELRTSVEKVKIPLSEEVKKPHGTKGPIPPAKKAMADFEVNEEK